MANTRYEPKLTEEQFNTLHEKADTRRKIVKVDRQALINLLMDHGNLWERLGE